jgi:hypothetical protein
MMVGKIGITKTEYESLGGLKQKRLGLGLCEIEFTVWRASWKDPFRTTLFDGDWLESHLLGSPINTDMDRYQIVTRRISQNITRCFETLVDTIYVPYQLTTRCLSATKVPCVGRKPPWWH